MTRIRTATRLAFIALGTVWVHGVALGGTAASGAGGKSPDARPSPLLPATRLERNPLEPWHPYPPLTAPARAPLSASPSLHAPLLPVTGGRGLRRVARAPARAYPKLGEGGDSISPDYALADNGKAPHAGIRLTGLPLPRFASLRADKVNLRAGPGVRYPVEWVYRREGLPVMIVAEFDAWRKVRDSRGTQGWIHRAMLSGRRTAVALGRELVLRRGPAPDAPAVARVEGGVVARLLACNGPWCRVEAGGVRGWGPRKALWGTFPGEKID